MFLWVLFTTYEHRDIWRTYDDIRLHIKTYEHYNIILPSIYVHRQGFSGSKLLGMITWPFGVSVVTNTKNIYIWNWELLLSNLNQKMLNILINSDYSCSRTGEDKGHTSAPRSPNLCGFLTLGEPGSQPPGPEPMQTTVSLNTAQANATFWHFPATGEYPWALKPHQWLRFIQNQLPSSPLSSHSHVSTSPERKNQGGRLYDIALWACTQPGKFIRLLNAHGDLGNQQTRMLCKVSVSLLAV